MWTREKRKRHSANNEQTGQAIPARFFVWREFESRFALCPVTAEVIDKAVYLDIE